MKLVQFKASDVYEYIDININFNEDLTFLVGGNGSGKTTAIKLIHAILTPNIKDLYSIPFSKIKLKIKNKIENVNITVEKKDGLVIKIDIKEEILELPLIDDDELEYLITKETKGEDFFNELLISKKDNQILEYINGLDVPMFLGLERRNVNLENEKADFLNHRDRMIRTKAGNRVIHRNRYITGSLGISLMETQLMVQSSYERIRNYEEKHRSRLRDQIISSSFNFIDFSEYITEDNELKMPTWKDNEHIIKRRDEIESVLNNLGTGVDKFKHNVDSFFNKMDDLFEELKKNKKESIGTELQWIVNIAQVERISKLIELIDNNKASIDKHFKPIRKFLEIINHFLNDSNKSIEIDNIGHLKVKKPNDKFGNIDSLSSGERQLLVLFSHLIFNKERNKSSVFIIDEPELSLHLKWQEEFVKYALEISGETQLIMATHSPEIILNNEIKAVVINGSENDSK